MKLNKNDILYNLCADIVGDDAHAFQRALNEAAPAFGISNLCDATGVSRLNFHRATIRGFNPTFQMIHNIVRGKNLAIRFVPAK